MGDSDPAYQFGSGIGEDELARLEAQGAAMATATRMILAQAGIRAGMRVLDLGCGAGDVSFLAADLVGPGGSVVGVDRSPGALARARLRAGQRGLAQVRFVEGDSQAVSATPMLLSTWATPRTEQDHASPLLEVALPSCGRHGPFRLKILLFMERTVALRQRPTMSLLWGHGDQR
jgi:SAM-dependent methyltransferase